MHGWCAARSAARSATIRPRGKQTSRPLRLQKSRRLHSRCPVQPPRDRKGRERGIVSERIGGTMRDDALKALLEERWGAATAKYAERLLKDPDDAVARGNRAIALYEANRWSEAAAAFEDILRREDP